MRATEMKIGSVLVGDSVQSFRRRTPDADDAGARLDLLARCVQQAEDAGCRLLVLPAGFFVVAGHAERDALERDCLARLVGHKVVVAFGIDVRSSTKAGARKGDAEKPLDGKGAGGKAATVAEHDHYDFYGYVAEAGRFLIARVAQTGIRTEEVQREIPAAEYAARCGASRLLGGAKVALLMCGEVRSTAWHTALGELAPDVVLHLAHASVPLGGTSKESWSRSVDGLMQALPDTAVWAFADHVRALGHWESGCSVPLVRRSGRAPLPAPQPTWIEHSIPAGMYIYSVQ